MFHFYGTMGDFYFDDYANSAVSTSTIGYAFDIKVRPSGITTDITGGSLLYVYPTNIMVTKNSSGNLTCDPPNAFSYCLDFLQLPAPDIICPLFYNHEIYNVESADSDSVYFSTVTNGTYKRIKITQGANGQADTVTIDKVIELENSSLILNSSTTDSTKKFKITVDDSGTLTATEVTESTT